MMKCTIVRVGCLLGAIGLLGCGSGGEDRESDATTAGTEPGPSSPVPSATGPSGSGNSPAGGGAGGSGTQGPDPMPTVVPFDSPFGGSAGESGMDDDPAGDDDDEPNDDPPDGECPASEPAEGDACDVPFFTACEYGDLTCNCFGMGGANRTWSCGDGFMFPGMDDEPEPMPEPEAPVDCPDGGPCEGPSEPMPEEDGGVVVAPDPENPDSCPEEPPPSDVCDIESVGFNTACRYGATVCTCGGFIDDGQWRCVEDEPEPEPEEPEPEPEQEPTPDAGPPVAVDASAG